MYDFSITADIYEKRKNGRIVYAGGGCCHEEIQKRFPELAKFIPLHLCNHYGAPMYPEANGFYHLQNSGKETTINYLRITEEEYNALSLAEDQKHFKYLLFSLGIVERWKKEADTLISELETLSGLKWENPYKPEEERFTLTLSDEERANIEKLIKDGFYTKENIEKRKEEARKAALIKKRADICARYDKDIAKAEREKKVMLYIFDSGVSTENVIYYNHSNTVTFNWSNLSYYKRISKEDFQNFLESVDYSKLPEGIKFEIK
ncbi:hypothetical protein [Bacteroides sp. HPS0048]|uniref:hypothetical protein n=1 Tax=Bacteroides sp. HPS0048 TaxID=1078089 RepID=UPI001E2C7922|nr:hypothetical protein [Bacteroides sp. HPS0048]